MPSADTEDAAVAPAIDDRRQSLVDGLRGALGDGLVAHHVIPGVDLWVRVSPDAWVEAGKVARDHLGMRYFNFLSAIDWMPSPYGRELDSEIDSIISGTTPKDPEPMKWGLTGGDTRFQVFARVHDVVGHIGLTLKVDVPDDLSIPTWIPVFAGANWHERETFEMYGIEFAGHPDLRKLYLPTEFEGNPLRKDFPLLARRVKPWPGIVDVEPMPGEPASDDEPTEAGE